MQGDGAVQFSGGVFKIREHEITKLRNKNAETADYSQNTQTDWECGDDANYVVYATIPARFFYNF